LVAVAAHVPTFRRRASTLESSGDISVSHHDVDVAIVGAGPAGARAACALARRGARVTIFDPSHPREKPCGGGVTGRALALVADAMDGARLPRTTIRSARFTAAGAADVTTTLDGDALVVASRAGFDAALLDAAVRAGAVLERARVTDVAADASGARLATTAGPRRAAFVVGADGANSLVRRRVGAAFRREQLSIATGFFAHGATSDEIVIEFTADPPGYLWSFPRPDHLAIGVCAPAGGTATAAQLRERVARWIADTGIARGARLEAYSWPIPSLRPRDLRSAHISGNGWALTGDAAGLVDPITREGIYYAIASGGWLAGALAEARAADRYAERVRDEALPELARAARLQARFFRPAFITLLLRGLADSPRIRAVMADLIAGRQPYANLRWRLIKTFEVGLLWQALTA
jgi:geranylgeranyl reductase family protein